MDRTAAVQAVSESGVESPAHPSRSGRLAGLVAAVEDATVLVRSMEARVDGSSTDAWVGMVDLAGVIFALNQLGRAADGLQAMATAAYARRDEVSDDDRPFDDPAEVIRASGFVHECSGLELCHVLRISEGAVITRTQRSAALTARLPRTLAAVTAGAIELWQAHTILDECRLLSDEEAQEVDQWLASRLATVNPTRLGTLVRYAIKRVNPDSVRKRVAKSRGDRTLEIRPAHEPGLSHIYALVPSHQAAAIWEAACTLAAQYVELDPTLALDQARADAFVDLVLADVDVRASLTLGMPVVNSTAAATGDAHDSAPPAEPLEDPADGGEPWEPEYREPVGPDAAYTGPGTAPDRIPDWMLNEANGVHLTCPIGGDGLLAGTFTSGVTLPKFGYIPADVIAALLARMDLTIARALIDATDGTVLETVTDAYKPNRRMRHFVAVRDGTCRMFGCSRPVSGCDLDHAVPHDRGGPTSPANIAGLCRFHHRAKQAKHWTYRLDPHTGQATWVCRRTGTIRSTHPATALAAHNALRRALSQEPELPASSVPLRQDPGPPPF